MWFVLLLAIEKKKTVVCVISDFTTVGCMIFFPIATLWVISEMQKKSWERERKMDESLGTNILSWILPRPDHDKWVSIFQLMLLFPAKLIFKEGICKTHSTTMWQEGNNIKCVVPENIHTPPRKGLEFPGGWGVKGPGKSWGGGVVSIYIIFSRPVPLFLYVKFSVCILLTDPRTQTLILLTAQN